MSVHLIDLASGVKDLGRSQKLALLAFANSATTDTARVAFPGYEGVMKWASVSRARAAELVRDLVAAGYLKAHRRARPGRRAEYIVFPGGCCGLHATVEDPGTAPTTDDLLRALAAAGVELDDTQRARLLDGQGESDNASENSDPSPPDESEEPDPFEPTEPNASDISDPSHDRVHHASEDSDACSSTTNLPPTPAAPPQGRCRRHTTTPGANCRACGTSGRQLAAAADRERAEARRLDGQERARRDAAQTAAAAVDSRDVADLIEQTKQTLATRRTG